MFNSLKAGRSFQSANQLKQYRKLLKSSALKIPAVPKNASRTEKIFTMANQTWIDKEMELALIQANNDFSDENFQLISNIVFSSPCIRAALLYTEAQAARSATNYFDWSGWLKGWAVINRELGLHQHPGKVDYIFLNIINGEFINQLKKNKSQINKNDFLILFEAFRNRATKLSDIHFDEMLTFFEELINKEKNPCLKPKWENLINEVKDDR